MELQLIRNATMRIHYAQRLFITDPYLAAQHTMPSYAGRSPNPLVELPLSPQDVIADIEMALISHNHSDHFDPAAHALLPKELAIYCQPGDQSKIESLRFQNVTPIVASVQWKDIQITRVDGQHGSGEVLADMGKVSGFVFQAKNEPTVYWTGDTIWCDAVRETIDKFEPDIIITHSCGAVWGDAIPIVMTAEHTVAVCKAAPNSTVVAVHMEALDHATVSREALRTYADQAGIQRGQLLIPADGENLVFASSL